MLENREGATAVPRRGGDRLEEIGPAHVERARCGEQDAPRIEQPHRSQIDLLVSPEGSGHRTLRLGERGRIHHDGVEANPLALHRPKNQKRIAFVPLDVPEPVQRGIPGSPLQGLDAGIEGHNPLALPGEVQGERAMIGEAVERLAARNRQLAGPNAVGSLIEKCAGLLTGPWRGEVSHRLLDHFDVLGDRARHQLGGDRKALVLAGRGVVPEQNPGRREDGIDAVQNLIAHGFETGREELGNHPAIVSIDDEGRESISLGVHHPISGCVDSCPASQGFAEFPLPPTGINPSRGSLQQAEPDFRAGGVEGLAEEFAAAIPDLDQAGCIGRFGDVTRIDPGVAVLPTLGPAATDDRSQRFTLGVAHGSLLPVPCSLLLFTVVMPPNLAATLRLMLVTDDVLLGTRDVCAVAAAAVRGGVTCVQLRLKQPSSRELVEIARRLIGVVPVPVLVNDRLDVALAAGAAGVHLGPDDMPVEMARRIAPAGFVIGASVGNDSEVSRGQGASYWGVGPWRVTSTKSDAGAAIGIEGFQAIVTLARGIPCVAIGGIEPDDGFSVLAAGGMGVAVVRGILGADEVEEAARRYRTSLVR